jgi:hypothetical protein
MRRIALGLALVGATVVAALFVASAGTAAQAPAQPPYGLHCGTPGESYLCTDVENGLSIGAFGKYVGHDEPSLLFYSNAAGSGNNNTWQMTLPRQPASLPVQGGAGGASWDFELHPAFWFGMAMCDSMSYPNYTNVCVPDSDTNIKDGINPSAPDFINHHAGTAFMEFQFYPPGWAPFNIAISCDPTKWCAALTIDSFLEQAVPFQVSNPACAALAPTGIEPINFAFITKGTSGLGANGPANPYQATASTYIPNPATNLFMNSGDRLRVSMGDTPAGFKVTVNDLTNGQVGAMVASPANGFAQASLDPTAATCKPIPYAFHPMYSTSSEHTRVPWAAHSYNVAYSDEIGHFHLCSPIAVGAPYAPCTGNELGWDQPEATDGDEATYDGCLNGAFSLLAHVSACTGNNAGFDGQSYQAPAWPGTGSSTPTPTPVMFKSPYTNGNQITGQYSRIGFETDLIALENTDPPYGGAPFTCSTHSAGPQCHNPPATDDSTLTNIEQAFYPIFSAVQSTGWPGQCVWAEGGANQAHTLNNFGGTSTSEYGPPLGFYYQLNGSATGVRFRYENYRNIMNNPCKN